MGRFQFGQIVLAYLTDGRGYVKERPALIISQDEHNGSADNLYVIAITKDVEDPCPDYHVIVHDSWKADSATGLGAPSVAKCNWVRNVIHGKVIKSLGHLDDARLEEIVNKFTRIHDDPSFTNWVGPRPP